MYIECKFLKVEREKQSFSTSPSESEKINDLCNMYGNAKSCDTKAISGRFHRRRVSVLIPGPVTHQPSESFVLSHILHAVRITHSGNPESFILFTFSFFVARG